MSIVDHFDHAPDAGFVRSYDSRAARRQFQVSLVLIIVLTVSAFALGALIRFEPPASVSQTPTIATSHDVRFAGGLSNWSDFAPRS